MEGVDVGMVSGHLGMPGIFVDVVDLREVDHIVPGDGHVNLRKPVTRSSSVDKPVKWKMIISQTHPERELPVRTDSHVTPVRSRLALRAGVEGLVPHHRPLRPTCDRPIPVKYVAHPLRISLKKLKPS